jgi:cyclophilin family peptidyl-prolyl cis-trans isomerase
MKFKLIAGASLLIFMGISTITTAAENKNTMVILKTSMGDITLELYNRKAPITVENFLKYVDEGFYKGTIFHRVINTFMIQGGGFDENISQKQTHPPIANEASNRISNKRGTIAMARTMAPNSATSQFFINTGDNTNLDFKNKSQMGIGYCVFGKVTEGMDVVDKIRSVKTGFKLGMRDVPIENVVITDIVRVSSTQAETPAVSAVSDKAEANTTTNAPVAVDAKE